MITNTAEKVEWLKNSVENFFTKNGTHQFLPFQYNIKYN